MDYRHYHLTKKEWMSLVVIYASCAFLIGFLFFDAWQAGCILLVFFPLFVLWMKNRKKRQKQLRLKLDFRELMTVLYSLMTAGCSLETALNRAEGEVRICCGSNADIVMELQAIQRKMQMNVPAIECLKDFAERSMDEDINSFYEVTRIARQYGGSMSAILKNAIERINADIETRCEVETMMTAKRNEFMIMVIVPVGILLYMRLSSPELMNVLYEGWIGRGVMISALIIYAAAVLWGEHMIQMAA